MKKNEVKYSLFKYSRKQDLSFEIIGEMVCFEHDNCDGFLEIIIDGIRDYVYEIQYSQGVAIFSLKVGSFEKNDQFDINPIIDILEKGLKILKTM